MNEKSTDALLIKSNNVENFERKNTFEQCKFLDDLIIRRSRPRFRRNTLDFGSTTLPSWLTQYPQLNPKIVYMDELRQKLPYIRKQLRPTPLTSKLYQKQGTPRTIKYKKLNDESLCENDTQTVDEDDTLHSSPISYYYSDDELWVTTPVNSAKIKKQTILRQSNSFKTILDFQRNYWKRQQE